MDGEPCLIKGGRHICPEVIIIGDNRVSFDGWVFRTDADVSKCFGYSVTHDEDDYEIWNLLILGRITSDSSSGADCLVAGAEVGEIDDGAGDACLLGGKPHHVAFHRGMQTAAHVACRFGQFAVER